MVTKMLQWLGNVETIASERMQKKNNMEQIEAGL